MSRHLIVALVLGLASGPAVAEGPFVPNLMPRADLNSDGHVPLSELIRAQRAIFEHYDRDGSNSLDAQEAKAFAAARSARLRHLRGLDAYEMRRVLSGLKHMRYDIDGNGAIDRSEFRLGATEWLAMLDRNGNGAVDLSDLGID